MEGIGKFIWLYIPLGAVPGGHRHWARACSHLGVCPKMCHQMSPLLPVGLSFSICKMKGLTRRTQDSGLTAARAM